MSFDALAESCKSLLAMPTVRPNTGSSPAVSGTSADVDKPPSFQFVSVSPKIERKPLAVPLMFGRRTSAVGSTWIPTALRLVLHLTQAVHLPKGELIIQAEVSLSTIVLESSSTTDAQTLPPANRTPYTARPRLSNLPPCGYWQSSKFDEKLQSCRSRLHRCRCAIR